MNDRFESPPFASFRRSWRPFLCACHQSFLFFLFGKGVRKTFCLRARLNQWDFPMGSPPIGWHVLSPRKPTPGEGCSTPALVQPLEKPVFFNHAALFPPSVYANQPPVFKHQPVGAGVGGFLYHCFWSKKRKGGGRIFRFRPEWKTTTSGVGGGGWLTLGAPPPTVRRRTGPPTPWTISSAAFGGAWSAAVCQRPLRH